MLEFQKTWERMRHVNPPPTSVEIGVLCPESDHLFLNYKHFFFFRFKNVVYGSQTLLVGVLTLIFPRTRQFCL